MPTRVAPTPAQINFLHDLLAKHEVAEDYKDQLLEGIMDETIERRDVSAAIDFLKSQPRAKKGASFTQTLLSRIPKSKYAIPFIEIETEDPSIGFDTSNDNVFFEVKQYNGHLYMRQLHGAPGDFVRSRVPMDVTKAVVAIVERDPYKYVKLFGELYTCCGCCGAPLTDARSRELMLGPECRKKFDF